AFSRLRKSVNAVPSAAVPELLHVYVLSTSWGSAKFAPPPAPSFCSHWSPVSLSVTVPSMLSTKRRVVVVVLLVVVVLVVVVVVGAAHSPAVQVPLQHWWFAVQLAR